MKTIDGFEKIEASNGEFQRVVPGGYICKITLVDDYPIDKGTGKGDYLKIEYDIARGEFTDFYANQFKRFNDFWGGVFYRSYKENALPMFKAFVEAVEASNKNYKWDWNEKTLVGKYIGLVLGEEEYQNSNGELKTRLYVNKCLSATDIKDGKFEVPELKKLKNTSENKSDKPSSNDVLIEIDDDDDLPF